MKKKKPVKLVFKEIEEFFEKAQTVFDKKPELADDYVRKARNLAMKYRLRVPTSLKRKFCKNCYCFLFPGKNSRIRTREGKVVITCFNCKNFTRIPYIRERKEKRKKN